MDFELPEELRMLRETVARFVREELIPLEPIVIRREAERGLTDNPLIPPEAEEKLKKIAKQISIYGIDVPERKAPSRSPSRQRAPIRQPCRCARSTGTASGCSTATRQSSPHSLSFAAFIIHHWL